MAESLRPVTAPASQPVMPPQEQIAAPPNDPPNTAPQVPSVEVIPVVPSAPPKLPPETGSAMAIETEAVAEAAIAAADKRFAQEQAAREKQQASEAAQLELKKLLADQLNANAFDPMEIRKLLATGRQDGPAKQALQAQILTIVAQAEQALRDVSNPQPGSASQTVGGVSSGAERAVAFDPKPYQARIKELL